MAMERITVQVMQVSFRSRSVWRASGTGGSGKRTAARSACSAHSGEEIGEILGVCVEMGMSRR
jgi:hypothetical protein